MNTRNASIALAAIALTIALTIGLASTSLADRNQIARDIHGRWRLLRMKDKQDQAGVGAGSRQGRFFTRGFIVEFQPNRAFNVFQQDSVALSDTLGTYSVEDDGSLMFRGPDGIYTEKYSITDLPVQDTLRLKGNKIVAWYIRLKPGQIMPSE